MAFRGSAAGATAARSLFAPGILQAAPPLVQGASMATKTARDALGYLVPGGNLLVWQNPGGVESGFQAAGNVLCPLDVPTGARLVQVDYYGYRNGADLTFRLIRFDASTGTQANVGADTIINSGGPGVVHAAVTGINQVATPGTELIAALIGSSASSAFVGVIYQYTGALRFSPVTPFRVYDSRWPGFPGKIQANESRTISVKDARNLNTGAVVTVDAVPPGVTAVSYNLTITGTVDHGFLSITPGGASGFSASAINWSATNQDLANGGNVNLNANREVKVWCGITGATHVILDITGYYT
jgi:hypothetical protein